MSGMGCNAKVISGESKIIKIDEFKKLREEFREKSLTVVHCHGVFDLLHPGHIIHLEQARALGDILLVSITAAEYVQKGPGRPYFSDDLRMKSIASLSCVDYVILSETETALEILDFIQPDLYVKGSDYEEMSNDLTRNIELEAEKVHSYGGAVHFTGGQIFSSTKLLNNEFPILSAEVKEFLKEFGSRFSFADIQSYTEKMQAVKILVVGDIIIDQYVFCTVQGLSAKDRALSALYEREEEYSGGVLAIARHLAQFSNHVSLCTITGNEPRIHSRILDELSSEILLDLYYDANFQTVIKRRYVERRGIRNDYDKLFSINYVTNGIADKVDRHVFYEKLKKKIPNFDLIVLSDFGHGVVDEQVMEIVQDNASFLAVNCQTNSANYGNNPISKYRRADTFTLDARELKLAFSSSTKDTDFQLQNLAAQLNSQMGWLTLGSRGAVGIGGHQLLKIPALTLEVQDTVGAGDAFFCHGQLMHPGASSPGDG
ncbi:MAG: cytidyltransferase [Firmicutes bacterium HGW-Firmicutes-15]|nr:MAG: cytidyltransferase [Firmicutes bacterium HGW-Firmicutes-15]